MAGASNLKAKPKASPSRIQNDIKTDYVIKNRAVLDNDMCHIAYSDDLSIDSLPEGRFSVPLEFWQKNKAQLIQRQTDICVQIAADEEPADLADDLANINTIVLPFVSFVDGRSYSHAYQLREQLKFTGEIRAVGDVHFDQLHFLHRVGCDAFELADGEDQQTALTALNEFSVAYQPAADDELLIFSRRRAKH